MDMQRTGEFDRSTASPGERRMVAAYNGPIGRVIEVAGSSSQVRFDGAALNRQSGADDPSLASAGQVGSQIKDPGRFGMADRQRAHVEAVRRWQKRQRRDRFPW